MVVVDRQGFINWTEGLFLDFHNGVGVVAPERTCIVAQEALDRGERVALTVDSRIVSYLKNTGEAYEEIPAGDEK